MVLLPPALIAAEAAPCSSLELPGKMHQNAFGSLALPGLAVGA